MTLACIGVQEKAADLLAGGYGAIVDGLDPMEAYKFAGAVPFLLIRTPPSTISRPRFRVAISVSLRLQSRPRACVSVAGLSCNAGGHVPDV